MSRTKRTMNLPMMTQVPTKAKQKILEKLEKNKRISTNEIEKILIRHHVAGDSDSLQHTFRLGLAQRLMAGIRDEEGRREVFAVRRTDGSSDYIAIDFCDDEKELKSIRHKIHGNIIGLEKSAAKVKVRIGILGQFAAQLKRLGH